MPFKFDPKYDHLIVRDFFHWRLYLHPNQCYLGRMYLAAKSDEYIELCDMPEGPEREEFFHTMQIAKHGLKLLFDPDLINFAWLANEWRHGHMHIVPRYKGERTFYGHTFKDECWGANFAPYEKNFQLDQAVREEIRSRLRKYISRARI